MPLDGLGELGEEAGSRGECRQRLETVLWEAPLASSDDL
jgi:hypothetical protein